MATVSVGDLVKRVVPRDGRTIQGRYYPSVYRVGHVEDFKPDDGGPKERGAIVRLENLAGESAGWSYAWDVEVVKSVQQQELEKLRVALARIAQRLGLNHRVPGNKNPRDFSYQALCLQARVATGWQALAALCIERIDEIKSG